MPGVSYPELLAESQPEVIRGPRAHGRAIKQLEKLMAQPKRTNAENRLLELLSFLVNEYEERLYPTPDISPGELLLHLLASRQITQAELATATGISKSTISALVNRQREASKDVARRLGAFFGVEPTAFLSLESI